ncbi:hypothetical protein FNF29_03576 [Cafeteria roenbergensis]|uniref:UDP-glucuronic acid decarboxylase 1 n=1 Tax=Cafeteria roenbergensis TaxID=33653 RepID=A0A5A8CKM0_CAFRO|nr:hypothetical protein FNF29_03576 [Cafeteria roenbergensis]KAA0158111.1 hypothetical protein FNF28_06411 [Cafeteria roenbergensis]|eukprot:KAA0153057.1 hypothetical protein FNF29_03576 [Cafeteria roenbergensis]
MASSAPSTALVIAGTAAASAIATALAIRFFSDAGSKADKASLDAAVRKALEAASRSAGPVAMPKASSDKVFPATRRLLRTEQQRILVTGGAGFVGSHLVDALMQQGHIVYVLDNLFTGRRENIEHWVGHPNFEFFQQDVVHPFFVEVTRIYHLACPASPPHYQANPIKTIKCSTQGCMNMLGLAKRCNARLLFTSTSEIYGDPQIHPQPESYWGNVHTWGPRACYDEGKRVGETMCFSYRQQHKVQVRVSRIFNTYGPRMDPLDGRVVSNFIMQALRGEPLTIYGTGKQTRSFQYVSDLVRGLIALMEGDYDDPVNIGNPQERTVEEFARSVASMCGSAGGVVMRPRPTDDPMVRRPNVARAREVIGWQPKVSLEEGLVPTIEYFKGVLGREDAKLPADRVWLPSDLSIPSKDHPDDAAVERVVADAPVTAGSAAASGAASA